MFLLTEPQPAMVWQNRDHNWFRSQIGMKRRWVATLTVAGWCSVDGGNVEAEFWKSDNWKCFWLRSHNQRCYGKMEMNSSCQISLENILTDFLVLVGYCLGSEVVWAEFCKSEIWECFCQRIHNHRSYGKVDVTAGFRVSERSRKTILRSSDGRLKMVNRWKKMLGRNFENQKIADVLPALQQPAVLW